MGAVGLKTYIWNNNFKSLLLLAGFPVLLTGMVYAAELMLMAWGLLPSTGRLGGDLAQAFAGLAAGVPLAVTVSLVWFAIAYVAYQAIIDLSTGARKVERADEPELYNLLENLAISRGMRTPALRIIEDEALNAFATGLHEGRYSVTVTTGLKAALSREEMEAVLAHEMTHVINRDVRLMVIASIFAGVITLLAQVIFRAMQFGGAGRRSRGSGKGGGGGVIILIALAIAAAGYLLALVIKMAISRKREFIADMGAVELTKNPDAMISSLLKISGHSHIDAPAQVRAMFLDDHGEGAIGLFATHPPIEKRIEALVKFAGGRLPEPPEPSADEDYEDRSPYVPVSSA
ncbi:MAG TPA: M48 family metallopeptidase [Caulobacteraceae bacterium]|jgi:heat shock protein HtpX